jgi:hypothetical protein
VALAAAGTEPCWSCRPAHVSWTVRRSCAKVGGIAVATACLRLQSAGWRAATWALRQAASRDSRTRTAAGRWAHRSIVGADAGDVAAVGVAGLEGAAARSASLARAAAAGVRDGSAAAVSASRRRARA